MVTVCLDPKKGLPNSTCINLAKLYYNAVKYFGGGAYKAAQEEAYKDCGEQG